MSRRILIILSLLVVFGQWASLEHAYHDHADSEICDYCLSAQPFDHTIVDPVKAFDFESANYTLFSRVTESPLAISNHFYLSRAPPTPSRLFSS